MTGVDRSPEMLAIAAQAVPGARLLHGDITEFSPPDRFDVIICMFDTLNHVQSLTGWLSLFRCVHEHLTDGGLFIFDVNTAGRLRRLHGAPPYLAEFDGNVVVMTVRSAGEWLSLWRIMIFAHQQHDVYRLHDERIYELAVPLDQIRAALTGRIRVAARSEPRRQPGQRGLRPGVFRLPPSAVRRSRGLVRPYRTGTGRLAGSGRLALRLTIPDRARQLAHGG